MSLPESRWRLHARPLLLLALSGLLVFTLAAWPLRQPGTMDSHYYYGGGRRLLQNRAFVEPYIWNYLDDPAGLSTPSHLYCMPRPSMLVALAQVLFDPSFKAAQIPFALLASGLPLISYATSWALSRNRRQAVTAPWFIRNWQVLAAPLSTAGTRTIFLWNYDELFSCGTSLTW